MDEHLQIITTADGSRSLLNTALNETYHSQHGALQESQHVFIEQGLKFFLSSSKQSDVRILEVGFGTGLNAYLTLLESAKYQAQMIYTSLETFPLKKEVWSQLNYASMEPVNKFTALHDALWNIPSLLSDKFTLVKRSVSLQEAELRRDEYHIVYFDAFAPNKQPEMWTIDILKKVCDTIAYEGVFVTYCAKGQLKRDLKTLGMVVETLPGPPGKKEMVRALKK